MEKVIERDSWLDAGYTLGDARADEAATAAAAGEGAPWARNEVGRLHDAETARRFLLGGNATVTVVSKRTGTRFTFKVRECGSPSYKENLARGAESVHFVKVLTGPDNEADYGFLGTIFGGTAYRHGRKSRIAVSAPSAQAFAWFAGELLAGRLPEGVDVYHAGRCGRCGRKLTVPESITTGFGPECAGLLGVR